MILYLLVKKRGGMPLELRRGIITYKTRMQAETDPLVVNWLRSGVVELKRMTMKEVIDMTRKTFFNLVARKADTKTQNINVAVSSRVTKVVLDELNKLSLKDFGKVLR